jgi:hypothetical protein
MIAIFKDNRCMVGLNKDISNFDGIWQKSCIFAV